MKPPHFAELVGAILGLLALVVVGYAALAQGSEQALGALMAVVAAATGFYLRGRVQKAGD